MIGEIWTCVFAISSVNHPIQKLQPERVASHLAIGAYEARRINEKMPTGDVLLSRIHPFSIAN